MSNAILTEQDQASISGPRSMKTPGDVDWCWQTVSALQSMWKSLDLDFERYQRAWQDAEYHSIWEKIPPDNPYGSKEAMLERLQVGDEATARARVAANAIPARPLGGRGGRRNGHAGDQQVAYAKTNAEYLTARIARDRPDIWERMKNGEFSSVAAAAREAGISVNNPKRVALSDPETVAQALRRHFDGDQLKDLIRALQKTQ